MKCWWVSEHIIGVFWRGISWTLACYVLVNTWVCTKGNDRVLFTRELFLVRSAEYSTYSCLYAIASYCIVLAVRIEGKGSGDSPCALIPSWRYVISRAEWVCSISECNVGGRPDGNRMNGEGSLPVSELFILRKQRSFLLQYCPVCRSRTWPRVP
jgi:hypothetical protein